MTYKISDNTLRKAAAEGMDTFIEAIADAIKEGAGGELSADTMPKMNGEQITLLAYLALREEVMDGGFIQLIKNGWGPFFFNNPFDVAMKRWGMQDLCRLVRKVQKLYNKHGKDIEADMSDDEFMALYEKFPMFDDFDDDFISNEELWTTIVATHVDENLDNFVTIVNNE